MTMLDSWVTLPVSSMQARPTDYRDNYRDNDTSFCVTHYQALLLTYQLNVLTYDRVINN